MAEYFLHNGYSGWSYGTPRAPQLVSAEDAAEIMRRANLSSVQVSLVIPPAQYATEDDVLYDLTGKNRFICFGEIEACADLNREKISVPMKIQWHKL